MLTHTLHYGCGAFEGVRAYNTVNGTAIFRLEEHTERLFNSAKILRMKIPFTKEEVNEAQKAVVRENKLESCYLRPLIYFPFPSGRLGYDCVTCQAKCCRGFGYMTTVGAELDRQFEMRPTLPLFVSPPDPRTSGGQVSIGNCAPGCFFLADDGRCDIHRERGFAAKPETCRLFPFNNFRRVGRFLIVARSRDRRMPDARQLRRPDPCRTGARRR